DSLAHHRAVLGLPALSVNWGPWAEGGMAASTGWGRSFALMGLEPLRPEAALDALGRLMADPSRRQGTVASVDWATVGRCYGRGGGRTLLEEIVGDEAEGRRSDGHPEASALRGVSPGQRLGHLVEYMRGRVGGVLRLPPERVEPDRPLDTMGLDSLM